MISSNAYERIFFLFQRSKQSVNSLNCHCLPFEVALVRRLVRALSLHINICSAIHYLPDFILPTLYHFHSQKLSQSDFNRHIRNNRPVAHFFYICWLFSGIPQENCPIMHDLLCICNEFIYPFAGFPVPPANPLYFCPCNCARN